MSDTVDRDLLYCDFGSRRIFHLVFFLKLAEGEGLNTMVHRVFCLFVINNFENLT